jgi:ubiquinone/menaquinone biosynthesis C-methylase UbiE
MNLPVPDNSFDAAYEIEATCHAPDKAACYERIFNALKPGGLFAGYEWVVTDKVSSQFKNQQSVVRLLQAVQLLISRFPFCFFFPLLSTILPTASTLRSAKELRSATVCL